MPWILFDGVDPQPSIYFHDYKETSIATIVLKDIFDTDEITTYQYLLRVVPTYNFAFQSISMFNVTPARNSNIGWKISR